MRCPQCNGTSSEVEQTIRVETGGEQMQLKALRGVIHTRRRRRCRRCRRVFMTIEVLEADYFDAIRALGEKEIASR